jgi:hypothetical protein
MLTIRRCLAALISLPTVTVLAATAPAVAHTSSPTSCPQYEAALQTYAPPGGWDVAQMSAIMARESNCDPTARSATNDSGLLQINDINLTWLSTQVGTVVDQATLADPVQNIQAGALLCTYWQARGKSCYFPWKLPARPAATPSATTPSPAPTTVPAPIAGRCTQYEALLEANAPKGGWDVQKMSQIMWRMSRCNATRRVSGMTGLLIISDSHAKALTTQLATQVDGTTLMDPTLNVRAAAALCQWSVAAGRSCYRPWGG